MKLLICFLATITLLSCAKSDDTKGNSEIASKWTPGQLERVADGYKGPEFTKFQIKQLAYKQRYSVTPQDFGRKLKSGQIEKIAKDSIAVDAYHYGFYVDKIAGKSAKQIESIFGKSSKSETVKPSRTPCPCPKKEYLDGLIEIVYLKGKADWITINVNDMGLVSSDKFEVQRHGDYAYIKAFTP